MCEQMLPEFHYLESTQSSDAGFEHGIACQSDKAFRDRAYTGEDQSPCCTIQAGMPFVQYRPNL